MVAALIAYIPSLGPFGAIFPGGTEVKIVQIDTPPVHTQQSGPSLETIKAAFFAQPIPTESRWSFELSIKTLGDSPPSVVYRIGTGSLSYLRAYPSFDKSPENKFKSWTSSDFPNSASAKVDVEVGIASRPWKVIATIPCIRGLAIDNSKGEFLEALGYSKPKGYAHWTLFAKGRLTSDGKTAFRIRLFDRKGNPLQASPGPNSANLGEALEAAEDETKVPFTFRFEGKLEDVARVNLESRPLTWKRFRDVELISNWMSCVE